MDRLLKLIPVSLALVGVCLSFGCATGSAFNYKAGPSCQFDLDRCKKTVAILPFEDQREEGNWNGILLGFVPLAPMGYAKFNRPDEANIYNFRPREDLPKALLEEITLNNMFEDVFYTERKEGSDADYFITGEIHETIHTDMMITYCASFYASLLWLVGLPAGRSFNSLDVDISLIRVSDEKLLWNHHIEGQRSRIEGLYYNLGDRFAGYSMILKDGYLSAVKSLSEVINDGTLE